MKKIFLADDSITIQKVVELTFPEGAYDVVCVGNGAAARDQLAAVSPDIALLDVIMPQVSGYDVCAQIKKEHPWMPVLLLTGAFEPYDENRAREVGADGHMTKPFESRALVSMVEKLLAEHPRPGLAAEKASMATPARPAPPQPVPPPAQTLRMKASEFFAQVPPGQTAQPAAASPSEARRPQPAAAASSPAPPARSPMPQAAAAPAPRPAAGGQAAAGVSVPPEMIDRAVREAVAGLSEKIVREVAWEVIPDLAEAIIRRRIRELEEEAEH